MSAFVIIFCSLPVKPIAAFLTCMSFYLQDGKIEAEVKLTGILSLGALQPGEVRKYGTVIAPGLYAPVHQHFFVARMDMAVDCKPGETYNQVWWLRLTIKCCVFRLKSFVFQFLNWFYIPENVYP